MMSRPFLRLLTAGVAVLTCAAADFGTSEAMRPSEVRNVRAGYLEEPGTTPGTHSDPEA